MLSPHDFQPRRPMPIEPMEEPEPACIGWLKAAADTATLGAFGLLALCFVMGLF